MAPLEQDLDQRDDVVDVLGRPRQDVGHRHPQGRAVGDEAREVAVGEVVDPGPGGSGAADDLVVDVGDVHDPRHRIAAPAQVPDQQVGEQERAEVADVGRSVDGRSAGVDPDVAVARAARTAGSRRSACRAAGRSSRGAPAIAIARALIERPAPSAPSRLPVDAFTLTALGSRPSSSAIASRIASRCAAEARPGRRRSSGPRRPAASRRPPRRRTTPSRSSRWRSPRASPASAGKRRPRSPRPAAPSSASHTACSATSPSECP